MTPRLGREALLEWTARIGAVTADALARREGASVASARGRLLAGTRRGELARTRPLAGEPAIFTVTRAGLRACRPGGCVPARVTAGNAAHAIACARVAVALERAYPAHAVLGEPAIRAIERGSPPPAGDPLLVQSLRALPLPHRPDMLLAVRGRPSLTLAVEVELTVKGPRRLARVCRAWARSRAVAGVVYVSAPPVVRALLRAIDAAGAQERVVVLALASLDGDALTRPIPSCA